MTPEESEFLRSNFALLNGRLAFNAEMLTQILTAILTPEDDPYGATDAVSAAQDQATMNWRIASETHGVQDGREALAIMARIRAEYAKKK